MSLRHVLSIMLLILLSFQVFAQDSETTPEATSPAINLMEVDTLQIRIGHFSLDAGTVDIYLNNARFIDGLAFQQVSGWLTTVPDTPVTVAIVPAGGALSEAVLVSEPMVFEPGNWVTVAVMGRVDGDSLHLQAMMEDFSPIGQGEARLSLFHAMTNQPPFDVSSNGIQIARSLSNPTTLLDGEDGLLTVNIRRGEHQLNFSLSNGLPAFTSNTLRLGENRHYLFALMGPVSNPLFALASTDLSQDIAVQEIILPEAGEIPVMTPEMTAEATDSIESTPEVESTDTPLTELTIEADDEDDSTVILTPTALPLIEQTDEPESTPEAEVTVETTTEPESTPEVDATPLPAPDIGLESGMMRLRVAHLAPGVEDLALYLNGDAIIPGIGFSGISETVEVEGMNYELVLLAPNRTEDLILYRSEVQLLPGAVMTLAITGSLETDTLSVQPLVENYGAIEPGLARLNFFQGIPDAQFLRLVANNTQVIISGINFPGLFDASDTGYASVDILAGTYRLRLEDENGNLLTATELRIGQRRTYLLIAAGLSNNAFFLLESDALPAPLE
ncbi:MAG: DUF4397 domain-containing protein [Aggregatilineales bacterium]